jgi:hypothetical protein
MAFASCLPSCYNLGNMVPVVDISVIRACRILFGNELDVNLDFLRSLERGSVKSAFRRRAIETHPDRFFTSDPFYVNEQTIKFIEVTGAYKRLNDFIADRKLTALDPFARARQTASGQQKTGPGGAQPRQSRFFHGNLPHRRLLFGEYLYYTGSIPYHVLTEAILWQRGLRPRFGDIALRWRLVSGAALDEIVRGKRFGELLGDSAVRLGKLSRFQVNTVLFFQRNKQRPIGEYFTANGHIMHFILRRLLNEQRIHNEQFRALYAFRKAD